MKPRRGKLVVLLAAALAAGLTATVVARYHDRIYQWWWNWRYGVPVVKTWEELRAQPAIELEDGVTIRIGIEATRVPAGRGVLVYCLSDGWRGPSSPPSYRGHLLGPARVWVKRIHAEHYPAAHEFESYTYGNPSSSLFARAVPLDERGLYLISIRSAGDAEIGSVLVETSPEPYHCWVPWRGYQEIHAGGRSDRGALYTIVENVPGPPVLPAWDGYTAWIPAEKTVDGRQPPRDGRLPPLVPDQPDADMRLAIAEGTVLTVRAGASIFEGANIEERFLARWWVNGKPFEPPVMAAEPPSDRSTVGLRAANTAHIRVHFDPSALAAKSGDRVGVQLLYFAEGWMLTEHHERFVLARLDYLVDDLRPRMTNRVEFTVP